LFFLGEDERIGERGARLRFPERFGEGTVELEVEGLRRRSSGCAAAPAKRDQRKDDYNKVMRRIAPPQA
jgi:hypothetical protein